MPRRYAIMTEDAGWHGEVLQAAFLRRGCEAAFVSLSDCRMDLASPTAGLIIPGFERTLPDGVFVRGVAAGTLEQITFRLGLLHALREAGVPVCNDARAIERSVDKSMTSFMLHLANVSTPATWVTESEPEARAVAMREIAAGRELVVKPLFGSQGIGLKRVTTVGDLPAAVEYNNVFYLQRFVDAGEGRWHDWRIFVVGRRVVAAMIRRGLSWINNVAQGGRCEFAAPDAELVHLAETATGALGLDYAGVDIIRSPDGKTQVVEVNSCPAWKGLQEVADIDIAQALVDELLQRHLPLHAVESLAS